MILISRSLLLILLVANFSCATQSRHSAYENYISLNKIEKLIPGKTSEQEVIQEFGTAPTKGANLQGKIISWLYFLPNNPKREMNLSFDSQSHILNSIVWFVEVGEPEAKLSQALSRFPDAHFKKHIVEWQQNDFISTRTTYIDNSLGIYLEIFEGHDDEVWSIGKTIPGTIEEQDGPIQVTSNKK